MADSQSKIDSAAEKAFADAAEKKTAAAAKASVDTKAVEKAVEVEQAPDVKAEKVAKAVAAPKKKAGSKKAPARKTAAKKTASRKKAAKKAPARTPTNPISQLKDTIMATAKTAKTADYTATAKEMAAEMQTRAKAAYDKGVTLTGEVTEFHKGNIEALVESGKLLASGMQDMGRTYLEDTKAAAQTVTEDVKKMATVKSPTELFQLQGEIARRNFDAAVKQTSKNTEAFMKLATDVFAPLSSRASVAAEKVSKAA